MSVLIRLILHLYRDVVLLEERLCCIIDSTLIVS
jgi:hypothetical protein